MGSDHRTGGHPRRRHHRVSVKIFNKREEIIMKRLLMLILALYASLGLLFAGASTASAHSDGPTLCITGACSWFENGGDRVWINDTKADGHSAVTQVYVTGTSISEYLWDAQGEGTAIYKQYGTAIPEGYVVQYRPCTGEYGTRSILTCSSSWASGVA